MTRHSVLSRLTSPFYCAFVASVLTISAVALGSVVVAVRDQESPAYAALLGTGIAVGLAAVFALAGMITDVVIRAYLERPASLETPPAEPEVVLETSGALS